jgi:hypothetical protein
MDQTLPPSKDDQSGDPEWLRQMRGYQETPDWLRDLIRANQQASEPADDKAPTGTSPEQSPPDDLSIDALWDDDADADETASQSQDQELWESGVEDEEEEQILLPEPDAEDIPDWLQKMSPMAEDAAPSEPDATEPPVGPPVEDEDIPEWLRDLSPPADQETADERDVPDWLAELDQTAETDEEFDLAQALATTDVIGPSAPAEPRDDEGTSETSDELETPDWLLDLARTPEAEQVEESVLVEPSQDERPADLRPAEDVEPAPVPGPEPEDEPILDRAASEETPLPAEREEFPDWLVDMAAQEPPEPSEEAAEPDDLVEVQELPSVAEIVGKDALVSQTPQDQPDIADLLYAPADEPAPQEPVLEFAEGDLEGQDMPEWIDELRVQESEAIDPTAFVETSGPLAGMRGLINPDPLFGLTPKATYAAMPPVPDVQQEQARDLQSSLAAPSQRSIVEPAPPARVLRQKLGRWLIYALLVIAICVTVFVPATRDLIKPPQAAETLAFYSAVSDLRQGSEVLLVVDYDASHEGELTPQMRAILWHLMDRDVGVIVVSHTPQGAAIVQDLIQDGFGRPLGQEVISGQHYLNLGYMPPHPALLQAFMAAPLGGISSWGTDPDDVAQSALGQRVARFDDLDLVLLVSSSQDHVRWWVEQVAVSKSHPGIVVGASASAATHLMPYYAASDGGQIGGLMVGLAGAAEYERLTGAQFLPSARESLILLGVAQLLLAAIVLASGIRSLFGRSRGA